MSIATGWCGLRVERLDDGRVLVLGPVLVTPDRHIVDCCSLEEMAYELVARQLAPIPMSAGLLKFPEYVQFPAALLADVVELMDVERSSMAWLGRQPARRKAPTD